MTTDDLILLVVEAFVFVCIVTRKKDIVWKLNKRYSNMFMYLVSLSARALTCFNASYEMEFE